MAKRSSENQVAGAAAVTDSILEQEEDGNVAGGDDGPDRVVHDRRVSELVLIMADFVDKKQREGLLKATTLQNYKGHLTKNIFLAASLATIFPLFQTKFKGSARRGRRPRPWRSSARRSRRS